MQQYRSGGLILVQAPANTLGTGVLFTQFKKANVGTGPIQTGIDRTSLDPNNPATRWFNAAAFTIPGPIRAGQRGALLRRFPQSAGLMHGKPVDSEALCSSRWQRCTVRSFCTAPMRSISSIGQISAASLARSATSTSGVLPDHKLALD